MKKTLKILSIVLIVLLCLTCINILHNNSSPEEHFLKRGKEILKDTYPDDYASIEKDITIKKMDNIWRVYNHFEPIQHLEDGSMIVTFGVVYHVDFDATTGEVITVSNDGKIPD